MADTIPRGTGYLPDPSDERDLPLFSASTLAAILPTPPTGASGSVAPSAGGAAAAPPKPAVGAAAAAPAPAPPKPSGGAAPAPAPVPPKPAAPLPQPTVLHQPVAGGGVGGQGTTTVPPPKPVVPLPQPTVLHQPDPAVPPKSWCNDDVDRLMQPRGPATAEILPDLPPIYDQGILGSCAVNAACAALRYAVHRLTDRPYKEYRPSRLFIYYYGRVDGDPSRLGKSLNDEKEAARIKQHLSENWGVWHRTVMHTFLVRGVCSEDLWPYGYPHNGFDGSGLDLSTKPNPLEPADWAAVDWQALPFKHVNDAKDMARKYGGDTSKEMIPAQINYYRIFDPRPVGDRQQQGAWLNDSVKGMNAPPPLELLILALKQNLPWTFGFEGPIMTLLGSAGETPDPGQINADGVLADPAPNVARSGGGHAMLAVGFDNTLRRFLIQNSWGKDFPYLKLKDPAMAGRFWMPYKWFEWRDSEGNGLTRDHWVIKFA